MEKKYALIEWEDEYVSIIDVVTIVHPRKEVSHYREGEVVKAKFKGAVYEAIICEISGKFKAPRASVLKSNSWAPVCPTPSLRVKLLKFYYTSSHTFWSYFQAMFRFITSYGGGGS